ncbi:unnamed protein product [Rotaria sp. Silwood1]|nr:unnamed protein product [Rotaria sp. Silwood1]
MDNHHSRRNDTLDLSVHGTSIQPGTISSHPSSTQNDSQLKQPGTISLRPSSARSDSQSKQPGTTSSRPSSARNHSQSKQPQTPPRGGSAKERRTSLSTSLNLSSARQRRLSNSSQRSALITSPPAETKKSITTSTSSSIFRVLSPHQHDVDAFFTDQSQQKSFEQKPDDEEWDETRRWVDEIHHLNSSFTVEQQQQQQQQNHGVGPMGMSRDSLNGTVTGTNFFPSNNNQHEQLMPTFESLPTGQVISTEVDLQAKNSSITNQQWHQQTNERIEEKQLQQQESNNQERLISSGSTTPTEDKHHQQQEITSSKETQKENNTNNNRLNSRRLSSASSSSSTSRHRITPISSPIPSVSNIDQRIKYVNSMTSSTSSSTTTTTSKVTLNDVYETLRKLEEVEKFPIQRSLADDSVYIIDPTTVIPSPFIDELPPDTSNHVESLVRPLNETNQNDRTIESVRSQKFTKHEISSPIMTRFTTPSQSDRRQQSKKFVQSVSIPHIQTSSSIDQQTRYGTKITTPYKSLTIAPYRTSLPEDEFKNSNKTIHDDKETRVSSRMDYEEKQRQSIINQQHESTLHRSKDFEQEFDYQLQKQKDEYESIIQRHLKFIDQLIDDKKKISHRCELLLSELKTIDRKYNDRMRSVEETHHNELQKLKDVHEAAEKLRREHWIEEKTKKIKELTVRGLEPEIQKLISKHKNELTKMKTVHEAELLASDERAAQRYIRMTEELRDQLEREKEVSIARERELAREKYEKSLYDEEKTFNEQRRRLYTDIEEEKNRQAEFIDKQRADLDKLRRDIEENHRTVVDSTKREYETIRLEQERRHNNEIQELKDKLALEKQNWEESIMKKQETILANKERELREQMKQERDKEIEKIIAQLESDTTISKEEAERSAENRVKRIRDKYEAEFHELENSEKQTREKFNQIKAQITEVQGDNERLQVLLKQKETEINDIKKITDTLQQERDRLSEIIRQEFADRLVLTEEENRRIKGEIAELRARQQLELEKKKEEIELLQQQQEKELETIHEKIKQAIAKKDEQVHGLHIQYETVVKRAEHLEGLLAQQRKLVAAVPSSGINVLKKVHPS